MDEGRLPPALSQDAIADAFASQNVGRFKYIATNPRIKWFIRNDRDHGAQLLDLSIPIWSVDATLRVRDCIRALCRELAPDNDTTLAREMCSLEFVLGVEQLAGIDRRMAATRVELGIGPAPKVRRHRAKRKAKPEAEAVQP